MTLAKVKHFLRIIFMRVFLIYFLNLYDALVTDAILTKYGADMELNPFMRWAFEAGIFLEIKIIVVALLCIFLYFNQKEARVAINFILLVYFLLAIYHAVNLMIYL
jgi:hypothetical protein